MPLLPQVFTGGTGQIAVRSTTAPVGLPFGLFFGVCRRSATRSLGELLKISNLCRVALLLGGFDFLPQSLKPSPNARGQLPHARSRAAVLAKEEDRSACLGVRSVIAGVQANGR